MDWLHLSGDAPSLALLPLGTYYSKRYYISDQCLRCLEDLTRQLNCDDTNHSRRRGLGYTDIINKDLKPIMISSCRSWPKLFRSTVRLLVGITTPIEHLAFEMTTDPRVNSHLIYELRQLLDKAKESFLDLCATRAIIDHAQLLLKKEPLSSDGNEFRNLSLLLVRNIVNVPERPGPQTLYSGCYELENCSQQNEIVCNLFIQGLGTLLLDMLTYPKMGQWVVTIAEVIAAIYKNRSAENIQARLRIMIESSKEVSFDKDGKNNLPWPPGFELQPPCRALIQTLSVTKSVSSDSTRSGSDQEIKKKKRRKPCNQKLGRTLRKDLSNEYAISEPLARFTMDFMLNGFSVIVEEYLLRLKRQDDRLHDKSLFLWLLVNFLPFAFQLGRKPEFIRKVLTKDLLCYLVWAVVRETEEVQLNSGDAAVDPKPSLWRLQLGIRAIFEYLQALEKYSQMEKLCSGNSGFSQCDREWVFQLRHDVMAMNELRQLFLLQLRHFNSDIQSHQCLCDIISANHALILTLERAIRQPDYDATFDLCNHLNQFCTSNITARYGTALQEFKTNKHLVNESIFTMLHCIGCDLGRLDLLCQPFILRPFCQIREEAFKICDDWHDLVEILIGKSVDNKIDRCEVVSPGTSGQELPGNESLQLMKSNQQPFTTMVEHIISDDDPLANTYEDVVSQIRQLSITGFKKQLAWIQSSLLTACATRLGTYAGQEFRYPV